MRIETELSWSPDNRSFTLTETGRATFALSGTSASVEVDGRTLSLGDAAGSFPRKESRVHGAVTSVVSVPFPGSDLEWQWELRKTAEALEVKARLRNSGSKELRIGSWNVIDLKGPVGGFRAGDRPDAVRFFRWRPWDMRVELLSSAEGKHASQNLCHLYDPDSGKALLCGFVTVDRMLCSHVLNIASPRNLPSDLNASRNTSWTMSSTSSRVRTIRETTL